MRIITEIRNTLEDWLGDDDRPIVIYSAAWPFFRAIGYSNYSVVDQLVQSLIDSVGDITILMPAFTQGYKNGICNLDIEHSTSGAISEVFRLKKQTNRSLSAFFSFSISGPASHELADLKPNQAWGEGSIYHWMEKNNVRFLMFGTDPTHCSYFHRYEWLLKNLIPYRFEKKFHGCLIRDGKKIECEENLFVRSLNPEAQIDFTPFKLYLSKSGMQIKHIQGIPMALYDSNIANNSVLTAMRRNPLIALVNKNDFKKV